jgi:subtilisin family serine protease
MKFFFTLLTALSFTTVFCQNTKWIIQFTDKNNSPYSISNPSQFLSQKAIDRRAKYHIAIDNTDLPVNPSYVQQVVALGATYLNQSKWLNQILISCSDSAILDSINVLPFVKSRIAVGLVTSKNKKIEEKIQPIKSSSFAIAAGMGDTLDYGASSDQVHIHHGEFLHNKGYTGDGITIAILDAGFYHYKELSAFDSIRVNNQVLSEKDFVAFDNSVDEDNVHGMYCLSTIAANVPGEMIGTAPHAKFLLLRSEDASSEKPIEEQNWVAAAEFADSAGADMISSSLGYFYFDDPSFNHSYADIYANTTIVSRGAEMAANKGMIVTNSAGNEGNSAWRYIIFPADADSVCAVGAINSDSVIAPFSSLGYPGKVKPNIVSVGWNTTIWGTNNVPVAGSGTSFSNPNINGLIACLWEAFPEYNNMTILNAVYQSSNKYNNPDSSFGYGIPDMHKAYLILKKKQNIELYGNDWLFANPDTFTNIIHVKLIGQTDGNAKFFLIDVNGNIIKTISLTTEQQEVYDTSFVNLDNLLPENYFIKYSDSITTRTITVTKISTSLQDWFTAIPIPFKNQLSVYLKAPESGKVSVRLIDAAGRIIETHELNVTQNNTYTINFSSASSVARGVYFIRYIGAQKRSIKVIK